jgi:hypothetical protein
MPKVGLPITPLSTGERSEFACSNPLASLFRPKATFRFPCGKWTKSEQPQLLLFELLKVGFYRRPLVMDTFGLTHLPLAPGKVQTSGQIWPLGQALKTSPFHSNLSISTGKSRAADRAGISVAPTAIAIATREIQTPSSKLG